MSKVVYLRCQLLGSIKKNSVYVRNVSGIKKNWVCLKCKSIFTAKTYLGALSKLAKWAKIHYT